MKHTSNFCPWQQSRPSSKKTCKGFGQTMFAGYPGKRFNMYPSTNGTDNPSRRIAQYYGYSPQRNMPKKTLLSSISINGSLTTNTTPWLITSISNKLKQKSQSRFLKRCYTKSLQFKRFFDYFFYKHESLPSRKVGVLPLTTCNGSCFSSYYFNFMHTFLSRTSFLHDLLCPIYR